jgi:hypothetical protein
MSKVSSGNETTFRMNYPHWANGPNSTIAVVYRGVDPNAPIESSAGRLTSWTMSATTPALVSGAAGSRLVAFVQSQGGSTDHSWASPMTRRGVVCCSTTSVADRTVGAGSTGTSAVNFTAVTSSALIDLILRPRP